MIQRLMIVTALAGLLGCSSSYSRMKSERDIAPFDTLMQRLDSMATEVGQIPTRRSGEPSVRLALHETGNPEASGPILVFVHGAFSDASAWRYVAGALGDRYTVWLLDLPSCGLSNAADPAHLPPDGYAPAALADRVYQVIATQLTTEPQDRRVVLVGHSYGSAIVMRMLADPELRTAYEDVRRRIDGLVLFTPLDVAIEKPIPILEYVAHLDGATIAMANAVGTLRERLAVGVAESYSEPAQAPREEVDRSIRILTAAPSRRATQAMILHATPRRPGRARPDWREVDRLVTQYANIDVPVRFSCGAHDETFPASMSYKLAAQVPFADLHVISDCMHSPHLERPHDCAAVIDHFVSDLKTWPARMAGCNGRCTCGGAYVHVRLNQGERP
jgi:pimeloyl-ACP methyl ester carboxylesterase